MQFQHTWGKVLSGEKTQTRRLVKAGETLTRRYPPYIDADTVFGKNNRTKYQVGQTQAVQPGRTKPAIYWRYSDITGTGYEVLQQPYSPELSNWGWKQLRIRITDIRREDVRDISAPDARAEGFNASDFLADSVYDSLQVWTKMHDPAFQFWFDARIVDFMWGNNKRELKQGLAGVGGWDTCLAAIKQRPAERYQAWALTFVVVK
jgi:hypothetical protein